MLQADVGEWQNVPKQSKRGASETKIELVSIRMRLISISLQAWGEWGKDETTNNKAKQLLTLRGRAAVPSHNEVITVDVFGPSTDQESNSYD